MFWLRGQRYRQCFWLHRNIVFICFLWSLAIFIRRCFREIILIFLVVLFSLGIKLKDIPNFSDAENVLSTYDAFRYARFAKEIQSSTYTSIDYLSNAPDFRTNFETPYLLSLMAVWLSDWFGVRIERLFVYLPPVLSLLYLVPFYMWIRTFADSYKSMYLFAGGAFLGMFNFIYAIRTPPGYFDTDCLILFFIFSIALFITYAVREKESVFRSYVYLIAAAILYRLFLWWYDVYIFAAFFLFSLAVGLVFFRHPVRDIILKSLFFLIAINPSFYAILWNIKEYSTAVFMKQTVNLLPESIFSTITEFQPITPEQFVAFTTDNRITAFASLVGFGILFLSSFRHTVIMLPFIIIGLSAFKSGNRYIMYLAPFMGMGIGYLVYHMFNFISERYKRSGEIIMLSGVVFTLFLTFPPQRLNYSPQPFVSQEMFKGLGSLKAITEKDALIWTWWDWGFAVEYLAERGTYVDGANYNPVKLYFIAKSLMTSGPESARRSIAFVTNTRWSDYPKDFGTLKSLHEQAMSYPHPPARPVYVMLDRAMTDYAFIQKLGFDETKSDNGTFPLMSAPMRCVEIEQNSGDFDCRSVFVFDIKNLRISSPADKLDVRSVYREIIFIDRDNNLRREVGFNKASSSNKILELIYKDGILYFMVVDMQAEHTIFHRMYSLKENFEKFELVMDRFPSLVVYKVNR
ncbi:MAG: hypothetical protein EPN22_10115 [Nitrospirae bacterium]|nr:MAG: hypothetical protein EPN22_10115 [Nitrospirota bacterium]